jgi:flagellar hook-associated protein 1 FlgK
MTLSSALNTATSSLQSAQTQTALVSRNIANANVAGATRKYVNVSTGPEGRVDVRSIAQSGNSALFRNVLNGTADVAKSSIVAGGLDRLNEVVGDTNAKDSAVALVSALSDALSAYRASPANYQVGMSAISTAQKLASSLNSVSATVNDIRRDADDEMAQAALDMKDILGQIDQLNQRIVAGTNLNVDVTDDVDKRDQAIQKLSGYVGISVQMRGNNDVVIHTDSGVTLYDRSPRNIEFTRTYPLAPGQTGGVFRIDNVPVTGDTATMPITSGKIAGLADLRDKVTTSFQNQIDTIARGLITAFAESYTDASNVTTVKQGLFQADDTSIGVAGRLKLASSALGDPTFLRDGGINGWLYRSNPDQAATGFTARLSDLSNALNADRSFNVADVTPSGTLARFAASSMSWLQGMRSTTAATNQYQQTLLDKSQSTLSNETGIDLNSELTRLLDLQRSFQASSKIITTVDQMMAALLQAV